ncbi:MAG: restriction endonuclease subunit S [Eubacteriales bacterium]|nr:restriction endonuclease subunit S [Petrimonas sp.]MEA5047130.1 restriction endonuclease subunit S [Eubacteriales bacterium]
MAEKRLKPAIRFNGYGDAWELRKLGELAEFNPKSELPNVFEYVDLESVVGTEMIAHREESKATAPSRAQRLAKKGDLFYQTVRPYQKNNYLFEKSDKCYVFSTGYAQMRPNIDGYFLMSLVQTEHFVKMVLDRCTGTSYPAINSNDLADMEICAPLDSAEQCMISSVFRNLDNLITLHQRKYDKLVNIKKSMLEKMFPQNGSNSPEIRFAGFTDAWELRKVGELLVERNEQAPMSEEYPLMAFIANEGVAPKGDRYDRSSLVSDTENKVYKKTDFGDFIYSSNNLETGSIGLNKFGKASISPVYSIFQPTGIADSDFLGRRLVRKDFINAMVKWRQGVIYGQWRIHESDFVKIEIPVPTVEEQRQIGAFLDSLDNLITLHQRELEKLQNIKKSCLEKMFV